MAKGTDTRANDPKAGGSKPRAPKADAKASEPKDSAAKAGAAKAGAAKAGASKAMAGSSKGKGSKPRGSSTAEGKKAVRLQHKITAFERKESKLAKQLDKLHDRQTAARTRLSTLAPVPVDPAAHAGSAKPSADGGSAPRTAFCLREKRQVAVTDAHPTVLRNGRAAIAGICASCGAKLVTLVARPS